MPRRKHGSTRTVRTRTQSTKQVPFRIGFSEAEAPPRWWHDRKVLPAVQVEGTIPTAVLFRPLVDQLGREGAHNLGWCV